MIAARIPGAASWDEALDFVVRRMRKVGPEAVGLWAGHGGFTSGSAVTVQMMYRFANNYGCQPLVPSCIELPPSRIMAGRVEAYAQANEMILLASTPVSSAPQLDVLRQFLETSGVGLDKFRVVKLFHDDDVRDRQREGGV
jgi:hypothetical protein